MKVIDIYDKNSDIRSYGKNIFKTMKTFLSKYPSEYSECYYHNLDTLVLFKEDRFPDGITTGLYNSNANIIFFTTGDNLGHEMFHMASNDLVNKQYAFESPINIEHGLIEGMTEYLNIKAYNLTRPNSYSFHVFCVMMMEDIPNLFRSYFIPSHEDFIKLFPRAKDIYSLLYSLSVYNDNIYDYIASEYVDSNSLVDLTTIIETVESTIDNLISIELSFNGNNPYKLNEYGTKFMDLIKSSYLRDNFKDIYPDYEKYAEKEIKKRIRGR